MGDDEGKVKKSINIQLIRHAESNNNEVYRAAHEKYQSGTPNFDLNGWNTYVDTYRVADPGLSPKGAKQAAVLGTYLVEHWKQQCSMPTQVIVSPMKRTLETLKPALRD